MADAKVLSEPDTELKSVSKTPLFKLSTSIFETVLLSTSIVLFVRVCVDVNCTILLFVIEAIFVAVSALPVRSPVTSPVTLPVKLPVTLPVNGPAKALAVAVPVNVGDSSKLLVITPVEEL